MKLAVETARAEPQTFAYCQAMGIWDVTPKRCWNISGNLYYEKDCKRCECSFRLCKACVRLGPRFKPNFVSNFENGLCTFHDKHGEAAEPKVCAETPKPPPPESENKKGA